MAGAVNRRNLVSKRIEQMTDKELLDTRICDLGLRIEESALQDSVDEMYGELADRGIEFRPRCWLSNDWFSPDGIPGIAIPFYLAHPRLQRLERKQMLDVEGGTRSWCMRILRHEAGHALDTAYRLHRRAGYRQVFGDYNEPYPEFYRPRPGSKSFVIHLEPWYAQSHPAEDFAETFAVWLKPDGNWREEYRGWKALEKIELVDEMMKSIAGRKPSVVKRRQVEPMSALRLTLREHYRQRHEAFRVAVSDATLDQHLTRLFAKGLHPRRAMPAVAFLIEHRSAARKIVAQWTGEYQYNIDQILGQMISRCRVLGLTVKGDIAELQQRLVSMLTVITMSHLRGYSFRVAL
ncbi:MAG TPA: putative zinc-binding metallopeptidase [Pirellulaceae bacterium]|nr:putative zinc-binding metallopeptidase [Pirellulaceae bacterium]